jgi:hypothetical protein
MAWSCARGDPPTVLYLCQGPRQQRDVEVSPGRWQAAARPLTAGERAAYASASADEIEDARTLLAAASDLVVARLGGIADRMQEIVEHAKPKETQR